MDNPRAEKVAVVDEVRERFSGCDAALLTDYRGIDVSGMQVLRRALREAGGEYKIYKNTLVRFAVRELGLDIEGLITGPTAIAFVPAEGGGDPVTVAKALRDFARGNPNLVVKGGVLGENILTEADARALAEIAPRDELLAKLAGLMAAPMQQFAGLLQAVPRDFAYGLRALIDQGGAPGARAPAPADESPTDESPDDDAPDDDAPDGPAAAADTTADTETDQTEGADAQGEAPAPVAEGDGQEQES